MEAQQAKEETRKLKSRMGDIGPRLAELEAEVRRIEYSWNIPKKTLFSHILDNMNMFNIQNRRYIEKNALYCSCRTPNCATRSSPWKARCPTCRESTTVRTTRTPRGSPAWRTAWRRSSGNSRSSRTPSCPWSWRSAATGSCSRPRRTGKVRHGASRGAPKDA